MDGFFVYRRPCTRSLAGLKAEYGYLVRGFLRLARQYEQDIDYAKATLRRKDRTAAPTIRGSRYTRFRFSLSARLAFARQALSS